jgi:hypothetical protein
LQNKTSEEPKAEGQTQKKKRARNRGPRSDKSPNVVHEEVQATIHPEPVGLQAHVSAPAQSKELASSIFSEPNRSSVHKAVEKTLAAEHHVHHFSVFM